MPSRLIMDDILIGFEIIHFYSVSQKDITGMMLEDIYQLGL